MRVAIVQCPAFGIDRPPLALGYLAAFIRQHGHEACIFDFNVDLYSKTDAKNKRFWEFQHVFQWMNHDFFSDENILPQIFFMDWAQKLLDADVDVIGFSVQSSSLAASLNLAKEIKKSSRDKIIVFGGPIHLSYGKEHADHLLGIEGVSGVKVVDIVVFGEGEDTLLEVLDRVDRDVSMEGCRGTVIRSGGSIIRNGTRALISDLDSLPIPDFRDFPDTYRYSKRLPILGSRGCVNKCVFCDDTLMWQYYRSRSPENIFLEMQLRKKEGIEFLEFNDLLINGNADQLWRLCELLISQRLGLSWGGSACIDKRLDLKFLKRLKEAGCCYLNYGIESASPRILRDMKKSFSIDEAEKVVEDTHRAGISACTNWIVGFPTETYEDFKMTLDFIKCHFNQLKNNIMVNSFILKYASRLFENKENLGVKCLDNWQWSSLNGENTVDERKRRYDEFLGLITALGDRPAHETFQG